MTGLPSPRHWTLGFWSALVCVLFVWTAYAEVLRIGYWKKHRTLNYDIETYYHYLPSTFIHGDALNLGYVAELDSTTLHPGEGQRAHGVIVHAGTGHHVNKCTCGVALFELPFFLITHAGCTLFDPDIADGYSAPYQLAVSLSAIVSTLCGLLLLRVFLLRYTHDRASALALIIIAFGTNLFFYSTVDSGMPHSFLFLLFSAVLERTDAWYRSPTRWKAAVLGLALGAIALIRPIDVLVVIVPLLWPMEGGLRAKRALFKAHVGHFLPVVSCAALPLLPQLVYWKATTDQWLYWSYGEEGFNWADPHIIDGLFSYRKGWFVYSPLALLGFIGLAWMFFKRSWHAFALPFTVFFPLAFYVIFSWYQWWYGGGFGCRPLISSLALLALPIALLAQWTMERSKALALVLALCVIAGIRLNMLQQDQYVQTIMHWDSMTRERYWEIWGHTNWDGLREFP